MNAMHTAEVKANIERAELVEAKIVVSLKFSAVPCSSVVKLINQINTAKLGGRVPESSILSQISLRRAP